MTKAKVLFVQTGDTVKQAFSQIVDDMSEGNMVGTVDLFLREKFWMVKSKIIDEEGNPWKTKVDNDR